jgi:hypothetical protein
MGFKYFLNHSSSRVTFHKTLSSRVGSVVTKVIDGLRPFLQLLLYVPDTYPAIANALRACDFGLLLINVSLGLGEIIHGGSGCVTFEGLLLWLAYALVHCMLLLWDIIKFFADDRR